MEAVMKHHLVPYISNTVIVISILSLVTFGGSKIYSKMVDMDKNSQLAIANYTESNKKNVLLKVIDTRMKIPVEQKVKLRDTIYDLCYLKEVPVSLMCALIEVESNWNPEVISGSNAKGLCQVLPSTARPYLRYERIDYTEKTLLDPIKNATVGVSYLADLQLGHIEAGKTDKDNWTMALHSYFWGGNNTAALYGKKDERVNVPNMSYPMRVLDIAKKYKELGL